MWWFLLLVALLGMAYIYWRHTNKAKPVKGMGFKVDHAPKESDPFLNVKPQKKETPTDEPLPGNEMAIVNLFRQAKKAIDAKDEIEAEKVFIQILGLDEKHLEANKHLGMTYLKRGLASKAEPFFKILTELEPKNVSHFSNLGYSLFMQNRLSEAKDVYEAALALDSSRSGRFASLAQVYMALKEYDHAVNLLKRAIDKTPENIDFLLLLADNYKKLMLKEEAKATLNQILVIDPEHKEAKIWIEELEIPSEDSENTDREIT